ncbi:MAG: glycosyltransferase [Clostridia bacterium]|nr:glycosyltransferase [Clostridia bacterium]MBQ8165085.1 glycosyltransferase [Clostridia bacterium]
MKLVQINVSDYGSTGNIAMSIQQASLAKGHDALLFCGRKLKEYKNCERIGSSFDTYFHAAMARLGKNGHASKQATKALVEKLQKINPDVILLHNIHGYYLNLDILFEYINNCSAKIFWTLHDCWAFTGGCAYFSAANCRKYVKGCSDCPICRNEYPKSLIDTTKKEYFHKKSLFCKRSDITFISPSVWLANLAKESFIANYPIHVINNGIDTKKFIPADKIEIESVRKKYNIKFNKKIILGVASVWDNRKQADAFFRLAKKLPQYNFVAVGAGCNPKEAIENLTVIPRTENLEDMVGIYSAADVFLNLSVEDNFPLVVPEALACGTPVISSSLCGSPEAISDKVGIVVNPYNDDEIINAIHTTIDKKATTDISIDCRKRAVALYDCSIMTDKYLKLLFAD